MTHYNKRGFAYESSVPSAVRADSYGEHKNKLNHKVSDCFVECSARALSLIVPPSPLSIGTTHSTKGLFRLLKWAPRSLPPGPSRVSLASPCTLRPPLRQRAARDVRLARAP